MTQPLAIPEEERPQSAREAFPALVARLSRLSVTKHFDAYADIPWDAPEMRIDPNDPRFELPELHPFGATAWYRALPQPTRARLGLSVVARSMKVGLEFESVLSMGLLAFTQQLPNGAPEFRYAYHELIEESQHTLMFQEFVNRSGIDPPSIGGWRGVIAPRIARLGARFPELFFLFVLGGEDPIDHVQRTTLASGRKLHPLLERISKIHITEEARHLCFARQYLRERVPRLSPTRRTILVVMAPVILSVMARMMLSPSPELVREFAIPRAVVDEAWRKNPQHHQAVRESLAKVTALCDELGLVTPYTRPLWRRLGAT